MGDRLREPSIDTSATVYKLRPRHFASIFYISYEPTALRKAYKINARRKFTEIKESQMANRDVVRASEIPKLLTLQIRSFEWVLIIKTLVFLLFDDL